MAQPVVRMKGDDGSEGVEDVGRVGFRCSDFIQLKRDEARSRKGLFPSPLWRRKLLKKGAFCTNLAGDESKLRHKEGP
jgi:hypothetical protein